MIITERNNLYNLLDELYKEKSLICNYDCCNCNYGILRGYGDGHSCSIEFVRDTMIEEDNI